MHTESPEQQSQEHNAACQISGEMDCENSMAKASNTACTIQDPHPKIKTQPGHNEFALRFANPYFFLTSVIKPSLAVYEPKQPNRSVSQPRYPPSLGHVPWRHLSKLNSG
jgi:hypothetical protein